MGLTSEGGGNWLTVIQGEITRRVSADTEGAKKRETKNGKIVWELKYNALEGRLTNISTYEGDYGKQWIFTFSDAGTDYMLALPYSSSLANGILLRLPNLKDTLDQPMKIKTYWIEKDGKFRQYLGVYQNNEKVAPFFTRDEPHGLPDMKKVVIKGEDHWDDTDRLAFLQKMVDEKVNPILREMNPVDSYDNEVVESAPEEEGVDDLPF